MNNNDELNLYNKLSDNKDKNIDEAIKKLEGRIKMYQEELKRIKSLQQNLKKK